MAAWGGVAEAPALLAGICDAGGSMGDGWFVIPKAVFRAVAEGRWSLRHGGISMNATPASSIINPVKISVANTACPITIDELDLVAISSACQVVVEIRTLVGPLRPLPCWFERLISTSANSVINPVKAVLLETFVPPDQVWLPESGIAS